MFVRKTRLSQYTLRLSSPRVTPSTSLSDVEWDNKTFYHRENLRRRLPKKTRYGVVVITGGLTVAILIVIAVLVPLINISKSTATESTASTTSISLIPNMIVTSTNSIITTLSSTETSSTSTSTISETTTMTQSTTISTTLGLKTSTTTIVWTTTSSSSSTTASETTTSELKTSTMISGGITTSIDTTTTTTETTASTMTTMPTSTFTSTGTSTTTTESTSTSTGTSTTTSGTTTSSSSTTTYNITGFLRWNTTATTVTGGLLFPIGIVIDSSDILYVADAKNNRIQRFVLGNSTGKTVAGKANGSAGSGAGFLNYSNDVAVDSNGNIYAVDSYNDRVQLWYVNASSGIIVAGNGITGNSATELNSSRGIAFDFNNDIFYISDTYNHRVMSYTLNSTVGTVVAGGNGPGNSSTQLNDPRGLYLDVSTNSLIIANHGANNIVRWVIGASSWTIVAGSINGTAGSGSALFDSPWDVTLDPLGNVYVADRYNYRIQFFRNGEFNGTTIAGITGASGSLPTKLNEPLSVALDSQLNLYVADTANNRIQKFSRY